MNFLKSPKRKGLTSYFASHVHQEGIVVSEDKKLIYMKPPKTGGTSILRNLLENKIPDIFHKKDDPQKFDKWLDNINDQRLEEYFIFSVTRNPWDRLVSIASYFNIPFNNFIENYSDYIKDEEIRKHSFPISKYTHLQGEQFVNFICRLECLQADMNLVLDNIGLERETIPHSNKTHHNHYSTYYNKEHFDLVERVYANDILNYGYTYDNIEQYHVLSVINDIKRWVIPSRIR